MAAQKGELFIGQGDVQRSNTGRFVSLSRALLHNRSGLIGVVLLFIIATMVAFGPMLAPYEPTAIDAELPLQSPSGAHWFGTDNFGRDMFSRVLAGARLTSGIALAAIALALILGVPAGLLSGYFGGRTDHVISAVFDVFLAFPTIFLGIAVVAVFGVGMRNVILAIAVVSAPRISRMARGEALAIRDRDYIEAAKALGAPPFRIIALHVLPNTLGVVISYVTIYLGQAVVIGAGLSFLGVGVQPPSPEWGALLSDSQRYFLTAPYLSIFPGIAITILVLAFNLAGDGLRDALDPRIRGRSGTKN